VFRRIVTDAHAQSHALPLLCPCSAASERYRLGAIRWIVVDPGRQMIGSFHPLSAFNWDADVPSPDDGKQHEDKRKDKKPVKGRYRYRRRGVRSS
jgi:hypothetical protein